MRDAVPRNRQTAGQGPLAVPKRDYRIIVPPVLLRTYVATAIGPDGSTKCTRSFCTSDEAYDWLRSWLSEEEGRNGRVEAIEQSRKLRSNTR